MRHSLIAVILLGILGLFAMPGSAVALNSQQERLRDCNVDARGMPGAARERFMSSCLSKPAEPAKPHCVKGKPCGNSCIAMDKVCRK